MLSFIKKAVDKRVDERINEILKDDDFFSFEQLSDNEAKQKINSFLSHKAKAGLSEIATLDIVLGSRIPADQVERVVAELSKEGKVKEKELEY